MWNFVRGRECLIVSYCMCLIASSRPAALSIVIVKGYLVIHTCDNAGRSYLGTDLMRYPSQVVTFLLPPNPYQDLSEGYLRK
jgi:hypothetical protein